VCVRARKNVTNLSIREIIDKNEKLFVAGVASRGKKKEENLIDWSKLFFLKFRVFLYFRGTEQRRFFVFQREKCVDALWKAALRGAERLRERIT